MKRILFVFVVAVLSFFAWGRASATTCTVPNTFSNGTVADANQVNANFSALQSCGNNIDYRNIGVAGLYASQLLPGTTAQATFGGLYGYSFGGYSTTQVPLTLYGVASQTGDLLDILLSVGGTKAAWVDSGGILHLLSAPAMSGASIASGTIPDAALVTAPVTSVTASGNVTSTGGTTPTIGFSSTPSFTSETLTGTGATITSASYSSYFKLGTAGTDTANLLVWGTAYNASSATMIVQDTSTNAVQGVWPSLVGFYESGALVNIDGAGNMGIVGTLHTTGGSTYGNSATVTGTVQNQPTGATVVGPAGACYQASGTACAGSFHTVVIPESSANCSASTIVTASVIEAECAYTLTFSGSAAFSSATSYACFAQGSYNQITGASTMYSFFRDIDNFSGTSAIFYGTYYYTATVAGTITYYPFYLSGAVCSGT